MCVTTLACRPPRKESSLVLGFLRGCSCGIGSTTQIRQLAEMLVEGSIIKLARRSLLRGRARMCAHPSRPSKMVKNYHNKPHSSGYHSNHKQFTSTFTSV